jgi:hypothetical protein
LCLIIKKNWCWTIWLDQHKHIYPNTIITFKASSIDQNENSDPYLKPKLSEMLFHFHTERHPSWENSDILAVTVSYPFYYPMYSACVRCTTQFASKSFRGYSLFTAFQPRLRRAIIYMHPLVAWYQVRLVTARIGTYRRYETRNNDCSTPYIAVSPRQIIGIRWRDALLGKNRNSRAKIEIESPCQLPDLFSLPADDCCADGQKN